MRAAIALACLVGAAFAGARALAGDYAARDILGFSPDGAYFAFEEYGVADGSGFPYSNTFVVATADDTWVEGTPIRLDDENENRPLASLRAEARAKAQGLLDRLGIMPRGGLLASNPETELSADPHHVRFLTNPYLRGPQREVTLTLTPLPMPGPGTCESHGPGEGFRLTLSTRDGGDRILHEDRRIPASRGCAQGYAISDVVTDDPEGVTSVLAILISVYSQGFEGPDRRFLAVTTPVSLPP